MSVRTVLHPGLCIAYVITGVASAYAAPRDEVLKVYGPTSTAPAIVEAAADFGQQHGITVEVRHGPVDEWLQEASREADLVYATAEFMMTRFVGIENLRIDTASITPLYFRPSVILVRPDNPKGIRDFPDLLHSGVRVMVVTGSGQTGLWEDMAGKLGDIRTVRDLRRNIVYFAPESDDAMRAWKQRTDIDAWITWNVWYLPLRDSAQLVPVGRNYRIYRQCSIALTARGRERPLARALLHHLTSPEGARVFESWGWMPPGSDTGPLTVNTDICAVCRVDHDAWKEGIGEGLANISELIDDYERLGITSSEVHISAVFDGEAAYWLLTDKAYAAHRAEGSFNPNAAAVRKLIERGVSVELCGKTMRERGWQRQDIIPGVKVVLGAHPRIIDLEQQGYAYLRF